MFDLRSARYFVAVAEELHFGRAAERLRMSQPPLSQAIRQLERDVGAKLFDRTNRRVALTAAGDAFLSECRSLLQHADAVAETPRLAASGVIGRITIGSVASALQWPLPKALAEFRAREPQVIVRIHEIDTDEAALGLLDGRIDVALARLATSHPGTATRILLRDTFCALLPAEHPLSDSTGPIDLADLADDAWIWLAREISPDYHDEMAAACRTSGFSPRVRHWARSIASQIALVECGAGVTIIPRTALGSVRGEQHARAISAPSQTVVLAATTRVQPSAKELLLMECIEMIVKSELSPPPS